MGQTSKERRQEHYLENREKILERDRIYRQTHKEKIAQRKKAKHSVNKFQNPALFLLYAAKGRASRKGLDFNLDVSDIEIPDICPILGIPIIVGQSKISGNSPSLDRVDSSKGYVKGNVAVISHKANSHKSDLTLEQVKNLVRYMENVN
jgi:hypothetical protein